MCVRTNVPTAIRALRRARGWRQADLGARATLSRDVVSRVENGELGGLTVGSLQKLAAALGAALVVELRWHGADLDRLVDRAHAQLQEAVVARLRGAGWATDVEVSFNHYGDRGRCDVVAWHAPTRTLLIVEAKTRFGNLQEMIGAMNVKRRLGRLLAEQVGAPDPRTIAVALVVAEHRTGRRILQRYPSMFAPFGVRGRAAAAWIAAPTGAPTGLLWFETLPDSSGSRSYAPERIRARRSAASAPHVTPDGQLGRLSDESGSTLPDSAAVR